MIVLSEVAQKLEKILNSIDSEVNVDNFSNPLAYDFVVEAQGFHIDHIQNKARGNNFIPVFLSSMGGQFNPVKGLKQGSYVIPITFYYPVRFRDGFFKLGDYLIDVFVGSELNYGTLSGSAISNLSVPTYGEIQNFDLQEFQKWVDNVYQRTIGVKTEPFMSMSINLYLTNAAAGFIFGNSVDVTLTYDGSEEDIVFANNNLQSNAQSSSEQELDATTPESDGLPFGTSYGMGFTAYVKNNEWWKKVIKDWSDGKAQTMTFIYKTKFKKLDNLTFTRLCFINSVNMPIQKGQILTITFGFGKKVETNG